MVVTLGVSGLLGLFISLSFVATPTFVVMGRAMLIGLAALLAFGLFEQWPALSAAFLQPVEALRYE